VRAYTINDWRWITEKLANLLEERSRGETVDSGAIIEAIDVARGMLNRSSEVK
jgi:hypothetical protein